jgi:dTDP-D-glucose 4,6-dehydratase
MISPGRCGQEWTSSTTWRRVPDNAKVKTMLGWTCDTTLESGLAKTIAWARANPWWLAQNDSGAG